MNNNFLDQLQTAHCKGMFAEFIQEAAKTGILFEVIPQLAGLDQIPQDPRWHPEGDVWTHTLLVLKHLPTNAEFAIFLAALLHDIGKASTTEILESGAITAHGHEGVSAHIAQEVLCNLGANEELIREVIFIIRYHMTAHNKETNARTLRRLAREGGRDLVDKLLQHGVADVSAGCRDFTDCERIRKLFNELEVKPEKPRPVLTGDEVMEITGLNPGPAVGHILNALSDLGSIDRDAAILFVRSFPK